MFCVMCAIDILKNKIMKSNFFVKKCQENVLLFMFLYIIRTPLLELKSVGKKCGLYTGKDGMLVILGNGNGSSHCIYHFEDNFYKQYHYIWGINQSSWLNIYQGKSQKGMGIETVSKINTYSDNSALELTQ